MPYEFSDWSYIEFALPKEINGKNELIISSLKYEGSKSGEPGE